MFSRNAEAPPATASWSIAQQLTLFQALSTFTILALASAVMYWGLVTSLHERSNLYIKDEINKVRTILELEGVEGLVREMAIESEALQFTQHYIRLMDLQGQILFTTPEMEAYLPISFFPDPPSEDGQWRLEKSMWQAPNDHHYQLVTSRMDLEGAAPRILHLTKDLTRREELIALYQRKLVIVLVFGILASVMVSILLTRRGLRPLFEINEATRRINANHLDERIQRRDWPEELTILAHSFNAMLERLQDSFSRLSNCTSNLAHELRNPINNLIGEAEVLLNRKRSPEEYEKAIESSLEEYQRLSRIFDCLLFLARSENGVDALVRTRLDVRLELEKVFSYYEAVADEAGVEVICQGEGVIEADPSLFRRAVANLLSNALKYTSAGGRIQITAEDSGDSTLIRISDTGCGIEAENLPRLCDRFYRVDETRYRDPMGVGLGLSIVKSIMDLHGGSVTIEAQPEVGTVVTLFFPSG
jgi:two-component system, OmpR family, heavy metal sensor histidine kinase CusS